MESDENDFSKAMRTVDSRMKQRTDIDVVELRKMYSRLSRDEKEQLREWINEAVALKRKIPSISLDVAFKVDVSEAVGEATAQLSPLAIQNAIASWDRGDDYAPTSIEELIR